MSQRVIACQVVGEYVTGDGVVIGAIGAHDGVLVELDFTSDSSGLWEGTTKTVTFTDALGLHPVNVLLTSNLLADGQTAVYQVPVPQAAMAVAGMMGITVAGVIIDGDNEIVRVVTELSQFRVLANHIQTWSGSLDVPASATEQLQAEIDAILDGISDLSDSVSAAADSASAAATSESNAEAWAVGQRNGSDVSSGDATYHNNSKYFAGQASSSATSAGTSATSADGSAKDSEAWAVGKRGGVDVSSGDATYHNNAKYWSDQAAAAAGGGVISFNGRTGAVSPQSGDYSASDVGAAPAAHDSTNTTYGKGSSTKYGHVKLSDSVTTSSGTDDGVAATPTAVKTVNDRMTYGDSDLTDGTSPLATGVFYAYYE